ncbi:cupin domain-containing protein [Cupriavidus basilensis]
MRCFHGLKSRLPSCYLPHIIVAISCSIVSTSRHGRLDRTGAHAGSRRPWTCTATSPATGAWTTRRRRGHLPYHIILGGQARALVEQDAIALGAGDVLLFPHGTAHTLRSLPDGAAPAGADMPAHRRASTAC